MNLIITTCLIWTNKIQKPALQILLKQQVIIKHGFVQTVKVCTGGVKMRKIGDCKAWFHTPVPQDLNSQMPFDFNEALVKTSTACSHGPGFPYTATLTKPSICHTVHFSSPFFFFYHKPLYSCRDGGRHWFPIITFPMLKSSLCNH